MHGLGARDDSECVATPPRIIFPGQKVHLTIQAVNRQYRFVPQKDVLDSIRFIFWHCVSVYGMAVHDMLWMSNHAHICMTDIRGVLPKFMCQMNSLISRQLNALRGVTGTNIEKGYSSIELLDDASMVGFCAYTLANPCAADLVHTAADWKGISTLKREYNEVFLVERPKCGMWSEHRPGVSPALVDEAGDEAKKKVKRRRKPSKLPDVVQAKLTRPDVMSELDDRELRQRVRDETKLKECNAARKRVAKAGAKTRSKRKSVLGWEQVLLLRWNQSPRKLQPIFARKPLVAARSEELAQARLDEITVFREEYAEALDLYFMWGSDYAVFPEGTWKMCEVYNAWFSTSSGVEPLELSG